MSAASTMRTEAAFQVLTVFGFKDGQARVEQLAFGDDDDVETGCDFITTENLSYQSFSSISLRGATQLSCRRDPQASHSELVREDKQRGVTPVNTGSALVYVLKVRAAADPLVGPEPGHYQLSAHGSQLSVESRQLRAESQKLFATNRQTLAPLGATAFQDQPSVLRAHSHEEPVRPLAVPGVRLERALALHAHSRGSGTPSRSSRPNCPVSRAVEKSNFQC